MEGSAYLVGRALKRSIEDAHEGHLVASVLADNSRIESRKFKHCTFANVSFLSATLDGCEFLNCVFLNCYFRKTTIRNCKFDACRFISCEFIGTVVSVTTMRFARFVRCALPYSEAQNALPPEPNLRRDSCRDLRIACLSLGDHANYARYHREELKSYEAHLLRAVKADGKYYKDHFPSLGSRLGALLKLMWSRSTRALLGYGNGAWAIVRAMAVLNIVAAPLIYFLFGKVGEEPSRWGFAFKLSSQALLPGFSNFVVSDQPAICGVMYFAQVVLTIVLIGALASYYFTWSRK